MEELGKFIEDCRRRVDAELDLLVPAMDAEPVRLHQAVRWSLFGSGKRFRPVVTFAVGDVFGAAPEPIARTAAAIEMIHTFSLIHDDLPAMDDDDLRRGRETCHKKYGEATAILAGDALQTLAFRTLADDPSLSADTRVRMIALISSASGTPLGMVAGQQLDLDAEGAEVGVGDLENIHSLKTGALITASAVAGAIIGGASATEIDAVERYAARLGLLFQITDDLLDVTQTTDRLGKTAGKDAAVGKATYPSHFGLDRTREMARDVYDDAVAAVGPIEHDAALLRALAAHILERTA